jgi:hypothetical protein
MELPFAVESPDPGSSALQQSDSSLVTASSQGSYINSGTLDSPLPPNTPQDVILPPRYDNIRDQQSHQQHRISGSSLVTPAQRQQQEPKDDGYGEPEIIDFTYVNVCETDADEVDILLDGGDVVLPQETQRGDVLTVLLSGMQQDENDPLVVRKQKRTSRGATRRKKLFTPLPVVDSRPRRKARTSSH